LFVNFGKTGPFFVFFTVKFRKDLREKLELKLTPLLKSVVALPCESKRSRKQLYIHFSKISFMSGDISVS